jgi:glucose uptake protein GlcU
MRPSSAVKLLLRLVHLFVFGWVVFVLVEMFRTEGWRAMLPGALIGSVVCAVWLAVAWWFDRLPEPEPQDWTEE